MTKVKIAKVTGGVEDLALLSAFKVENNTYAIFDGEKLGSMGLPIIYVSKLVDGKLEKINDTNEWQSAKNYLKGIINGTNFEYIKLSGEVKADEAYFTPLTLPSESALELIKSHYTVSEDSSSDNTSSDVTSPVMAPEVSTPAPIEASSIPEIPVITASPVEETAPSPVTPAADIPAPVPPIPPVNPIEPVSPIPIPEEPVVPSPPVEPISMPNNPISTDIPVVSDGTPTVSNDIPTVSNDIPVVPNVPITNEISQNNPVNPVMPNNDVISNTVVNSTNVMDTNNAMYTATPVAPIQPASEVNTLPPMQNIIPDTLPPVQPLEPAIPPISPVVSPTPSVPPVAPIPNMEPVAVSTEPMNVGDDNTIVKDTFDNDKETFLKACENMFDALISKYQKQLAELNDREQIIKQKEIEIEQKMHNASEHLANAEAREQVANIAHDNAQKVMDLNNFMPINNANNTNNNQTGVM